MGRVLSERFIVLATKWESAAGSESQPFSCRFKRLHRCGFTDALQKNYAVGVPCNEPSAHGHSTRLPIRPPHVVCVVCDPGSQARPLGIRYCRTAKVPQQCCSIVGALAHTHHHTRIRFCSCYRERPLDLRECNRGGWGGWGGWGGMLLRFTREEVGCTLLVKC
jgi:hypothetical protein